MRYSLWISTVVLALAVQPTAVHAQRSVTTDTTQNGGEFSVVPAGGLFVYHPLNDPILTLTNFASTSGVEELHVGYTPGSRGQVVIEGGSTLTNSGDAILGNGSTSRGIVTVNNSQWQNDGQIYVGWDGKGTLNIENWGIVNGGDTVLGYFSGRGDGTVNVIGTGSQLYAGPVIVGFGHTGVLNIESGGYAASNYGVAIGDSASATGVVTVTGAGSQLWSGTYLQVGTGGAGTLNIVDGGFVYSVLGSVGGGYWGPASTGTGNVNVSGAGSLWYAGETYVGRYGTGTLTISEGGVVQMGIGTSLNVGTQGLLTGDGGTVLGNVINHGVIAPGASPGILTIDGDLIVGSSGQLHLEISGLTPGLAYDQLEVTGDLLIDGVVQLSFGNGFLPSVGDRFELLRVGGAFDATDATIQWLNAPDDMAYDYSFGDGAFAVQVRAVPEPSSFVLLAMGIVVAGWHARKRRYSRRQLA